jgi:hypothetical protein
MSLSPTLALPPPLTPSVSPASVQTQAQSVPVRSAAVPAAVRAPQGSPAERRPEKEPKLLETIQTAVEPRPSDSEEHPGESLGASGTRLFDGGGMRVHLNIPGAEPVSAAFGELAGLLSGRPDLRESLARSGRVRLVLPGGAPRAREETSALSERLAELGIRRGVEVESLSLEPAEAKDEGRRSAPYSLKDGFLVRQLLDSFKRPSRSELAGGLLSALPGFTLSMLAFAAMLLPEHWPAFGAMFALTAGLKVLHNVYADSWSGFQNRLQLLRGSTYLATFNFLYGQTTAAVYRLISWLGKPGVVPPWDIRYWRDMGIMSVLGTVIYTLGNMAVNDLYNKGILTRRGRAYLQQFRSFVGDIDGVFFKLGAMTPFWIAFALHQAFDIGLYPLAAMLKPRPILYVAPSEVAESALFRELYLSGSAENVSPGRRLLQALAEAPFVSQLIAAVRRLRWTLGASSSITPERLAADYARAAEASASSKRPEVAERLERVEPVIDEATGKAKLIGAGISQPVVARRASGELVVFKRSPSQGMSKDDPNYKYERFKLACDIVASFIMEKMGVPTIRYRMGRAAIDGKDYLGVFTPFLPELKTAHALPGAQDRISNPEEFVRGAVMDAWLGNTDRISSLKNIFLLPDGRGGRAVVFGDYDQAMRMRSSMFGVPKVPLAMFARYADPRTVDRAVADIAALPDETIRAWVDEALAEAHGYGASWRDYIADVLIYNRDPGHLRETLEDARSGKAPVLHLRAAVASAMAEKVLKGERDPSRVPSLAEEALKPVLYLSNHPELRGPMKALLEELARRRLAGEDGPVDPSGDALELLPALVNFVWAHFSPEEAIAGSIAYNR